MFPGERGGASRPVFNGLMAEVIEEHVHVHVASPDIKSSAERMQGAEELVGVIRAYLK